MVMNRQKSFEYFPEMRPLLTWLLLLTAGGICPAAPIFETTDVFLQGTDGYHSYRLPVSVATADGTLLLFADGRKDSAADTNNKIDPVLRRSTDGGQTWTEMQILATDPGDKTKMGNCTAVYDAETDTVHLVYLKNLTQAFQISTTDGGETFSSPNEITSAYDEFDFSWEYFATGHVHGIQLEDGRLMLPVWMSDHPRDQDGAAEFRVGVLYSDDHGATFHAGGTIVGPYDNMNETTIYEGSNGTVYANSRVTGLGYRAISSSSDAGMTWSTPSPDYELSDPTCQASTLVLPSTDGVNRLLFCNPAGPDRTHLTVRMSYDNGATWPVSRLIDAGPSGYCDMAADDQGNIYVFYENNVASSVGNISMAKFNLDWVLGKGPVVARQLRLRRGRRPSALLQFRRRDLSGRRRQGDCRSEHSRKRSSRLRRAARQRRAIQRQRCESDLPGRRP